MRKLSLLLLTFCFAFTSMLRADEGMWLLPLVQKLNIEKMQEMGFKLTAEDIYSINKSSLKDAVVIFGGGCTGELISDKGLILTNHHCGYGAIQQLSSVDHNYLEDGFWAKNFNEELPAEGLKVTFLKYMEDVTTQALEGVTAEMSEEEREAKINSNSKAIATKAAEGNHYKTMVRDYFNGNQFFLVVYEVFEDVRLVGTPPSSIGKFGHDTDNWMWPRHTGDFSMFRVYADKDGKPAKYSKDNVPFKPAHHLPISLKGVEMEDFAMTIGFPGSTDRYLTSWGIEERMNIINQSRIVPRGIKQDIWLADMKADEKVNIQYASKYAGSSNYWKNSIGMNRGLEKLNVLDQKRALENTFAQWVAADQNRKAEYGEVLPSLQKNYTEQAPFLKANQFLRECMIGGTEIYYFALRAGALKKALENGKAEEIEAAKKSLDETGKAFYKNYYNKTDEKVMGALLKLYHDDIDKTYHPAFFAMIAKKYKGDFSKYAADLFKKSIFADEARFNSFIANPSLKALSSDAAFTGAEAIIAVNRQLAEKLQATSQVIERSNRLFLKGLMEMQNNRTFYPDANFTMRLSYGKVGNYEPKDGVIYKHYTTLTGVMEKEDPNNWEFVVSPKLKELYKNKDFGQYADKDGYMPVCFTTDNDITGGNSGSPVINANGELFGLAFDGNWEAMSGDIAFETQLQKCINVDIRYVLFIIDKYAGATNLIEEMTLVK
ncbi:MAG: S46 family peptidase [Breznakibacter sp.]|nr:S46 family peptidase [Breznakibacter sp.]